MVEVFCYRYLPQTGGCGIGRGLGCSCFRCEAIGAVLSIIEA